MIYIERFQHQPPSVGLVHAHPNYMYMYCTYTVIHVPYMFDIPQQGDCKPVDLVMFSNRKSTI